MYRGKWSGSLLFCALPIMVACPARAGEPPTFTPQDFALQNTFLRHLTAAKRAIRNGNLLTARIELRRAARDGNYQFETPLVGDDSPGCGGPVHFTLPSWLPQAQALAGDVDGAMTSAKAANSAPFALAALNAIADAQAGCPIDARGYYATRAVPTEQQETGWVWPWQRQTAHDTFVEFLPINAQVFAVRRALPDPSGARATAIQAFPYAQAVSRLRAQFYGNSNHEFPSEPIIVRFAERQARRGDLAGARVTLHRVNKAWERAAGLAQVAFRLPLSSRYAVLAEARREIQKLPCRDRAAALLQAAFVWVADRKIEKSLIVEALLAATREPNKTIAFELATRATSRLPRTGDSGSSAAPDKHALLAGLRILRNIAQSMPKRGERVNALKQVAEQMQSSDLEADANRVLVLARK